ncbi:MAG: M56 family metallopeptidase [Acidobacteriota bacterium]
MIDLSLSSLVFAGVENFILINTILSLVTFTLITIIRTSKLTRVWYPSSLARLFAVGIIFPPVLSSWLVIASLLPAVWLGTDRWAQEHRASHTLHLLNAFTFPLDPVLGYAALVFALVSAIIAIYAAGSAYFRISNVVRRLEIGAEPAAWQRIEQVKSACHKYGIDVGLVVSNYPFSFVWGYFRSKLIVSTGLLNALTEEELAGLLEHEAAHHARRDNLSKWILTVCKYSSPVFPLMSFLYRWWSEQVEMLCDEIAARRTQAPVEIAAALVRLKKLSRAFVSRTLQPAQSGFFSEDKENFERRVERILSLSDKLETVGAIALSRSWATAAIIISAGFTLSLLILFLASPLVIHRIVEAFLHIF